MEMTFEQWKEKFKPTREDAFDEVPEGVNPLNVWTEIWVDGAHLIASGFHFVNRLGYFVTEIPFPENESLVIEII